VDVAAGNGFGIGLRADGTIVAWGDYFQTPTEGNHDLVAIDAMGYYTVVGLHADGSIEIWGDEVSHPNYFSIPEPNIGFSDVDAGLGGIVAIRGPVVSAVDRTVPAATTSTLNLVASPNPFNPQISVSVRSAVATEVTLEVLDVRGRRVHVLWQGNLAEGASHSAVWDGRDRLGQAMPSGTYLVQARTPGDQWTVKKISLIR
jgi:hypothetical protein